jgi:hypothetical protein
MSMQTSLADSLPQALSQVRTRPLFVMHLDVPPLQLVGATPAANRRIAAVPSGRFEGERLCGTVLEGGSDWQSVHTDGAVALDVRLVLKATDNALIAMTYRGLRHGSPAVLRRLEQGEDVDPSTYYFRISAHFETAAPQYDWLNRLLALGIGYRRADGPLYSLFEVL